MKKLLALLLALIMCLTVLTSCDAVKGVVDQIKDKIDSIIHPEEPVEYQIDKAEAFLKNMYKDVNPVTGDDYEVVGQIRVANVAYTVTWTSNTEEVKIVALENGNYLVDLNENSTKKVPYTLTATITAGNGDTATVVYEREVPDKTAGMAWEDYMKAEKGDFVIVKGIVVAMNGKSGTNKYNHLYLADESGKGGYYAYKLTDEYDPIAKGVKVGMTVVVSGECSPYSGMHEIFGGTFTIVDETIKPVAPIDITEYVLAGNTDFSAYVALPVTIKGVTIGTQELDVETSQYLNFSIGGLNSYIRTYVTDFPTTLTPDDKATIDKAHADHFGYKADVTGIVVLYSGNPYLIPMSVDCFTNFTAVERTPEEKIAAELSGINLPANVGTATVVDLPLAGANYTDVAISWTSDSANAVVGTDGKLTISLADEATTVTLTATLTCGDKTVTETFEIAVAAKPNVVNVVVDAPVVGEEYYFMVYQANLGRNLFITGEMDGYYFATTSDIEAAVKVKVVDAGEGKYDLMVGDKYLGIEASGTYINVKYLDTAPEGKFVWNTEYKTFTTTVNDTEYYFGTYGTFQTFSASKLSYAATSFVAHLIVVKNVGANVVDTPVVGNEYYFMTKQENLNKDLYITGEMNGYYFATTTDVTAAAKVKVVDAGEGKYDLMVGDKYLGIVASGTYINVKYLDAAPENKFTWNTEYKTFVTIVNDTEYYFGTYGTFETFSASKLSYAATSFVSHLIEWVEDPNAAPEEHECAGGNATCEAKAVCSVCGKEYGELADHTYEEVVTPADCVNGGYTTHTCSVCEDSYVDNNTDALGHAEVPHEAQAATCTEKGWDAYVTCSRCDYTTYEEIPALQHADENNDNVCDREDCKTVLCDEDNHVAGEATKENEVASTCTEAGSYESVVCCTACGTEISRTTVPVDALGHDEVNNDAKAATCTEKGWNAYVTCSRCDYTTYEEVDALGHKDADANLQCEVCSVYLLPEVGTAFHLSLYQKNLGKTLYFAGAMNGYYYKTTEKLCEATDLYLEETDGGYYIYFMSGETKNYLYIQASGTYINVKYGSTQDVWTFDEVLGVFVNDVDGTDYYIGTYNTFNTISASKLSFISGDKSSSIGVSNFPTRILVDNHTCSYSEATCAAPKTCVVCGATEGEALTTHTPGADATCDTAQTCTVCGKTIVEATGDHNYVDGTCSVCGKEEPTGDEPVLEEKTASLSFANKAQRTTFNTSKQVWEQNGITLTNDKGSSTSNVADYANPARFYKSSKITITAPGQITKIAFTCNSSSYATALKSSIAANANYTVTVSGSVVTVTFVEAVDSFVIASLSGGQVRMNSMSVTYLG